MEISLLNICYKIDVNTTLEHQDKPFKMEGEHHKIVTSGENDENPPEKNENKQGSCSGCFSTPARLMQGHFHTRYDCTENVKFSLCCFCIKDNIPLNYVQMSV